MKLAEQPHLVIQGEGKFAGVPHVLLRMTGCKLRCQFKNSFCDTLYASWNSENVEVTEGELRRIFQLNPQIMYTMISGGSPTSNPKLLEYLVDMAKDYGQFVTIETEGSDYVETDADFISLSPKLSNSIPQVGSFIPNTNRQVTIADVERHNDHRNNFRAMGLLIRNADDYQLKPVVSELSDLEEIQELQKILHIPNDKVYLMPEGEDQEQLNNKRKWLFDVCIDEGYNYTDRLHIIVYGNKKGV